MAGRAGPGAALLVTRPPAAVAPLSGVDAAIVTDELLAELWGHVQRLHSAHVTHGQLNADHVMLGTDMRGHSRMRGRISDAMDTQAPGSSSSRISRVRRSWSGLA